MQICSVLAGLFIVLVLKLPRGHSSAGRAVALQAKGRRFDADWLHHGFTPR